MPLNLPGPGPLVPFVGHLPDQVAAVGGKPFPVVQSQNGARRAVYIRVAHSRRARFVSRASSAATATPLVRKTVTVRQDRRVVQVARGRHKRIVVRAPSVPTVTPLVKPFVKVAGLKRRPAHVRSFMRHPVKLVRARSTPTVTPLLRNRVTVHENKRTFQITRSRHRGHLILRTPLAIPVIPRRIIPIITRRRPLVAFRPRPGAYIFSSYRGAPGAAFISSKIVTTRSGRQRSRVVASYHRKRVLYPRYIASVRGSAAVQPVPAPAPPPSWSPFKDVPENKYSYTAPELWYGDKPPPRRKR